MTSRTDPLPPLYVAVKGGVETRVQACALAILPGDSVQVRSVSLGWSAAMAARLREIAQQANSSGRPAGKALPYGSLRAAIQVQLPETVLLSSDLGRPWEERGESALVLSAEGEAGNLSSRAAKAVSDWTVMVLKPWSGRVGVDEMLVDAVADLVTAGGAFDPPREVCLNLGKRICEAGRFEEIMPAALQIVSRRLGGLELFEGLGPVYRIIRPRSGNNWIDLMTWPTKDKTGGRFSMLARLAVETAPYVGNPILTVRAWRRSWLSELPDPRRLRRDRSMRGYLLANREPRIAVEFSTPVQDGSPEEPFSPEYMRHALNVRADLGAGLADMVARQGAGEVFVGIPYAPSRGGRRIGGSGATARDQSDLYDRVAGALAEDGFSALPFVETPRIAKAPKRAEELHKALKTEALLADVALSLGRNELSEAAFKEAWMRLSSGNLPPKLDWGKAEKAQADLATVRQWNRDRVGRVFGAARPRLVLIAASEQERTTLQSCVEALFGSCVEMIGYALPSNVHGARANLPKSAGKAEERFAERVASWGPLTDLLSREQSNRHVLVQAADRYGKRPDDPVNKLAGRCALAWKADANVQYLLPPGARPKDFANYLHRVQAASYDLLFGHSGLVSEIGSVLEAGFPDEDSRPKSVIGISVVTQARTRSGAKGGRLCFATRLDAAGGPTTARVGWFDGRTQSSPKWLPLFEVLKLIASPAVTATLGRGKEAERSSFQAFVKGVVGDAVQSGERPLVLIDSTSAAALWPSLTDSRIAGGLKIGSELIDVSALWAGARVVRVRKDRAGRLVLLKSRRYVRIGSDGSTVSREAHLTRQCPTITERTVRLASLGEAGAAHYWMTHKYFQMSVPRGLSVYRSLSTLMPATKNKVVLPAERADRKRALCEATLDISDVNYRLPLPIDVTVALLHPGDDPDRIAHVVASLRHGYGHTPSSTLLPAPLSFESKVRDYMTRFALDEADADDEDEVLPDDQPGPLGNGDEVVQDEDSD